MDDIYSSILNSFIISDYIFDESTYIAKFYYNYKDKYDFCEEIHFVKNSDSNLSDAQRKLLGRALALANVIIGTSYYKSRPTTNVWLGGRIDHFQREMFDTIYQDGLSQFAYENNLTRADLGSFSRVEEFSKLISHSPDAENTLAFDTKPIAYNGNGILALQSGGKDSILTATILNEKNIPWTALYISSDKDASHPQVIDELGAKKVQVITRIIDHQGLKSVKHGLNGHVPVTYINTAIALVQAILNGNNKILTSIGHEGAEPHTIIKSPPSSGLPDLPVNHQWSKTWEAEQLFAEYISRYISDDIKIGSILRQYSELKIAELFAEKCWEQYGHRFSSCNRANYRQGKTNTKLHWCGECAKCANSYLLFAPFIEADDLNSLFPRSKSLFEKKKLVTDFEGLLGIDDAMKPFECVGEIAELRKAYHLKKSGYPDLPFTVPKSDFDYNKKYPGQKLV
ncbi:hypothetical protein IKG12_02675 [Candidatus Saccharibacteria bacterium]|nr:hypothetical protein [Candidatus Saccharibacteria bacterium]